MFLSLQARSGADIDGVSEQKFLRASSLFQLWNFISGMKAALLSRLSGMPAHGKSASAEEASASARSSLICKLLLIKQKCLGITFMYSVVIPI